MATGVYTACESSEARRELHSSVQMQSMCSNAERVRAAAPDVRTHCAASNDTQHLPAWQQPTHILH